MRIVILTFGTQGDVQPYMALGLGLKQAGHEICLATNSNFEIAVRKRGLNFYPLGSDSKEWLKSTNVEKFWKFRRSPLSILQSEAQISYPTIRSTIGSTWEACQDAEAVICALNMRIYAYHVVERLKVPAFGAYLTPVTPTSAYPNPMWPGRIRLGSLYNQLTYQMNQVVFWQLFRKSLSKAREEILNLPPLPLRSSSWQSHQTRDIPILYGYSPHIVPRPPDWGERIHITGYWLADHHPADWQPPSELVDFLQSGPPPVYIGFGSMINDHPEQMAEIILKALKLSKQRGVLHTGWGALSKADLPDDVLHVGFTPFDWLFPKMAALIHHGGFGTVALGIRSGIPSIIIPFLADHFFWGYRLAELGVGPKPIARGYLSAERLSEAIKAAVNDREMRARAAALGKLIRAEDGVARAVEIFQHYLVRN